MGNKVFDWNYQIEEWTFDHSEVFELLAGANNFHVATAAYDEVCRQRPNRPIYMRNGIRVIRRSEEEPR